MIQPPAQPNHTHRSLWFQQNKRTVGVVTILALFFISLVVFGCLAVRWFSYPLEFLNLGQLAALPVAIGGLGLVGLFVAICGVD